MSRTVVDLDDGIVAEAMRLYGVTTKAAAVRAAMEDAVKRRLHGVSGALNGDGVEAAHRRARRSR